MRFLTLFLVLIFFQKVQAQEVVGLWNVSKVTVGSDNMTPIAKWFRFKSDRTYESGNGWLQNSIGTWEVATDLLTTTNTYGLADEYGAFQVIVEEDKMTWERMEDGMKVVVHSNRISEIPVAPADLLAGLWKPEGGNAKESLFIRSDRVYVKRASDTRHTGYWHINGHRSEVTFLPHEEGKASETWEIEVDAQKLTMTGISEPVKGVTKNFIRSAEF